MRIEGVIDECGRHARSTLTFHAADNSVARIPFPVLGERARRLADKLAAGGLKPGQVVGLQAQNHPDWIVWDLALAALKAVMRPYPTHHVFDPATRIVEEGLALLVSAAHAGGEGVAPLSPEAFDPAALRPAAPASPETDLHSIVYSSGTTGREKVLKISRTGAAAALDWFTGAFRLTPDDRHLVFLPLSNFQQRQQVFGALDQGVDLTLCDYPQAMRAVRADRPTFLIAPPALYENMLSIAEASGVALPDLFGGAVRFLITGMAPIRPTVMSAYWEAGMTLLEGYGLTECGIIACNTLERVRPGTVGPLVDPGSFRLGAEGEILIRQEHPLSLGYLGADDLNAETFLPDGTVRTGDVGRLDEDDFLVLEGRIKDMIPLPSGRKLHPGDLEQLLLQVPGVEDAVAVDNGAGVTAVLNVTQAASQAAVKAALRAIPSHLDAAGAVSQIIFTDIPLRANPIFSTANMKLNRRLVGRHFLGAGAPPVG
jgi:long-subunit acyl-CoA synthetase (AMP-forming)